MFSVNLEMPPSVNSIWRSTLGRNGKPRTYRAKTYAAWMHTAAWTVKSAIAKTGQLKGDVKVSVDFCPRKGDLDNRLKAICDSLVQGGAIEDDKNIISLTARWNPMIGHQGAFVRIEPA